MRKDIVHCESYTTERCAISFRSVACEYYSSIQEQRYLSCLMPVTAEYQQHVQGMVTMNNIKLSVEPLQSPLFWFKNTAPARVDVIRIWLDVAGHSPKKEHEKDRILSKQEARILHFYRFPAEKIFKKLNIENGTWPSWSKPSVHTKSTPLIL